MSTKTITINRAAWNKLNDIKAKLQKMVRKGKVTHSMVILTCAAAYEQQFKEEETN